MSASTRILGSNPYAGALEGENDLVDRFGTIVDVHPGVVRDAQRLIAGHLADPAVVGEVLDMLGIRKRVS